MFEDIPLDTRHHTFRLKPKFPKEWRLTPERREELKAIREQALLADEKKNEAGTLVDGVQRVREALASPPRAVRDKVAELVAAPRTLRNPKQPALRR
jgi:small subunit ribosomal protein S35